MRKIRIDSQYSEGDIYNVSGDLNVTGSLNVSTLTIQGSADDIFKHEQQILKEENSISYIDFIHKEFDHKRLLPRIESDRIKSNLESSREIILSGNPGIGKTCILFQISKEFLSCIYLSVRHKSPTIILSHLINKIKLFRNEALITVDSVDSSLQLLEFNLSLTEFTFLIDDAETNPEIVEKIMSLEKSKNKFVYATRNEIDFSRTQIRKIPINALTDEECRRFCKLYNLSLTVLEESNLIRASSGNPLYLFYFSQFQISPLPSSIEDYHNAIWTSLNTLQQEFITYTAICYTSLPIDILKEITGIESLIDLGKQLEGLQPLLINEKGKLSIFHSAFREFIKRRLESSGIIASYLSKLGEVFLNRKDYVQAAYTLIRSQPEKVNSFGFYVMPRVLISGDLTFAIELMTLLLTFKRKNLEAGYIHYHLSYAYRLLYKKKESKEHLDKALSIFRKLKDKKWFLISHINLAMNLIEEGDFTKGLQIADEVLEKSKLYGDLFHGQILVNLSKIYVDLNEFTKGAKTAKEAFELFEKHNDKQGMISSLANLTSCLARLDEHSEDAEKYALKLLELAGSPIEFTVKLIALNVLASLNRQKGNYDKAKEYGLNTVRLCQQFQLQDRLILNLINYGNIFRDQGELTQAVHIYEEALLNATNFNLYKDQSRAYWILASVYREIGQLEKSIEYADKSEAVAQAVNFTIGIASAYEQKAHSLRLLEGIKKLHCTLKNHSTYIKLFLIRETTFKILYSMPFVNILK
jgi:tetratricopeptide (TPR) repeat protein